MWSCGDGSLEQRYRAVVHRIGPGLPSPRTQKAENPKARLRPRLTMQQSFLLRIACHTLSTESGWFYSIAKSATTARACPLFSARGRADHSAG